MQLCPIILSRPRGLNLAFGNPGCRRAVRRHTQYLFGKRNYTRPRLSAHANCHVDLPKCFAAVGKILGPEDCALDVAVGRPTTEQVFKGLKVRVPRASTGQPVPNDLEQPLNVR
jgi:hypothetical protein